MKYFDYCNKINAKIKICKDVLSIFRELKFLSGQFRFMLQTNNYFYNLPKYMINIQDNLEYLEAKFDKNGLLDSNLVSELRQKCNLLQIFIQNYFSRNRIYSSLPLSPMEESQRRRRNNRFVKSYSQDAQFLNLKISERMKNQLKGVNTWRQKVMRKIAVIKMLMEQNSKLKSSISFTKQFSSDKFFEKKLQTVLMAKRESTKAMGNYSRQSIDSSIMDSELSSSSSSINSSGAESQSFVQQEGIENDRFCYSEFED